MANKLKSKVLSTFKMNGLTMRSEATSFMTEILSSLNEIEREDMIDRIVESVQNQNLSSNIIDTEILKLAVRECDTGTKENSDQILSVFNAFQLPKFVYKAERKKFIRCADLSLPPPKLLGNCDDKANLYRDRYNILFQRTSRHHLFTPPIPGLEEANAKKFKMRKVEYLLGCTSKLKEIIVLGMLTQLEEAKYFLEDLTGTVQLDLSQATFHPGIFTENSFVLAEGSYDNGLFHVAAIGFPPPETSQTTRSYYGNLNFFGGISPLCAKASVKLQEIEKENKYECIIFLSEVWLDKANVLKKLETLFLGFKDQPPITFVFSGPFISEPYSDNHSKLLTKGLNDLAKIIVQFPLMLQKSKMIFVPSCEDLSQSKILPKAGLPNNLTEDFLRKIPNSEFTSNPCRIQYCTQEIVVFRENMVRKMCRNAIHTPKDDIYTQFVKSILAQGHLTPLPLHVSPVYWPFDYALSIYPLPDVIVFSDSLSESFNIQHLNCTCINPGTFSSGGFNFTVYYPFNKEAEESTVDD